MAVVFIKQRQQQQGAAQQRGKRSVDAAEELPHPADEMSEFLVRHTREARRGQGGRGGGGRLVDIGDVQKR